jgi:hypothetical protein
MFASNRVVNLGVKNAVAGWATGINDASTAINNEGVIACTIFNNLSEDRAGLLTPVNSN